ncbi:hypothetical protein BSQ97_17010 [Serratia proteamaculans]|nr:hypothetical protein F8R23_22785 [Serratia proteamaculans]RYM50262.1 hypothetical protein BSQ97_17010 [Serratia proteamaculans]RYM53517.1 hypothetical protein BSQ96_12970 [Serratia proteamaculans]
MEKWLGISSHLSLMTKLSLNPRYPGLAHRGALRRASRYDPFGTLSLITGFVSSLKWLGMPSHF